MADEENIPPEPPCGGESCSRDTLGLMLGGTPKRKGLNGPRGIPQPINMEVAWDPNVLTNLGWWDETGMWLYSIIGRYVG